MRNFRLGVLGSIDDSMLLWGLGLRNLMSLFLLTAEVGRQLKERDCDLRASQTDLAWVARL